MNSVKEFINTSAINVAQSYDKISSDVSNVITPIIKTIKQEINVSTVSQPVQPVQPDQLVQQVNTVKSTQNDPNQSIYVGCYSDDPSNPSMDKFLGSVSNISECITMGRENNFKYVGIRGGNECFASNTIPTTQSVDKDKYCNVGCDDIGTENCGGFYYNQVYKTTIPTYINSNNLHKSEQPTTSNAVNILENFINLDNDITKITMGLNINDFTSWKPLNSYIIYFWLIILLFLIYLLFEYLYK